ISYHSISSGLSEKVIVPLALVNDGFRWHLRAFDRTKNRFADFVLTRIIQANILLAENIEENETINNDIDWNRIVKIELVPHPNHDEAKKVIEMDFGMTNGKLELALRASNIGYVLQQWRVDCSSDHHIDDPAFRLWLLDNLVLYGINNAEHLAPAFDKKRSKP
ncbi:WYL domain-containing protein, partial [Neisseria meningitidis]